MYYKKEKIYKNIIICTAIESDREKIWVLVEHLVIFERYRDSFVITREIAKSSGFRKNSPDFYCLVAEHDEKIVGILVYYFLTYTVENRPSIYMKELFVDEAYGDQKIGEKLMDALKNDAKRHNCTVIEWAVAPWNKAGQNFYERLGAKENKDWSNYELKL